VKFTYDDFETINVISHRHYEFSRKLEFINTAAGDINAWSIEILPEDEPALFFKLLPFPLLLNITF